MGLPWQAFGFTLHAQPSLGSLCSGFLSRLGLLYAEKLDLAISMPLSRGIAVCAGPGVQVGATWAKSPVRSPKSGLEVPSRSKVWTVGARCSVGVMETAGNGRAPAQTQVKAEGKVCLSDNSYDQIFFIKMVAQGCLWEHLGALKGLLGRF